MLRALIVDDEPLARSNVRVLLGQDPEIELAGECGSGREAVAAARELRPDLMLLDVQMPGLDGFAVLEELGAEAPPAVIFLTAYDQYALKAFEVAAIDYLLKPFDDSRFARALERAKQQLRGRKSARPFDDRLIVRTSGRVQFMRHDEIDWIEAADYYACLHAAGKTHMLRRSMSDLERDLDPDRFCRIHRSTIVNLRCVREVRLDASGEPEVVLEDQTVLRLSRSYRQQLQNRLRDAK